MEVRAIESFFSNCVWHNIKKYTLLINLFQQIHLKSSTVLSSGNGIIYHLYHRYYDNIWPVIAETDSFYKMDPVCHIYETYRFKVIQCSKLEQYKERSWLTGTDHTPCPWKHAWLPAARAKDSPEGVANNWPSGIRTLT